MKKICFLFLCFIFLFSNIKAKEIDSKNNLIKDCKSAILIEASSGKIIYEKNSHERYAPASMTNIMTT